MKLLTAFGLAMTIVGFVLGLSLLIYQLPLFGEILGAFWVLVAIPTWMVYGFLYHKEEHKK